MTDRVDNIWPAATAADDPTGWEPDPIPPGDTSTAAPKQCRLNGTNDGRRIDPGELAAIKQSRATIENAIRDAGGEVLQDGRCKCPFHRDKNPSAGIKLLDKGWQFTCFAGCDFKGDAIAIVQKHRGCTFREAVDFLNGGDIKASVSGNGGNGNGNGHAKPPKVYATLGEAVAAAVEQVGREHPGARLGKAYRYTDNYHRVRVEWEENGEPKKTFREVSKGGTHWTQTKPKGKTPLYRVDELPATGIVAVHEGEKATDAAWSIGMASVTSGGSTSARGADWTALAHRDVVIFRDNDESGVKYAGEAKSELLKVGARVRVVLLPDLPDKGDIYDFIEQRDSIEPDDIRAGVLALADAASVAAVDHYTDLGNAQRLVDRYGNEFRYTEGLGFLVSDGRHWQPDDTGAVHRLAMARVREMHVDAQGLADADRVSLVKHALASEGAKRIGAMLDLAKRFAGVAIADTDLDRDGWLYNVLTGTIEIDKASGEWRHREHRRDDLITKLVPVRYDPDATCPTFTQFIREIFLQDEDMIAFAQRALGSCLVASPEEILHVWYGGGENGKSTLISAVTSVLGDYATTLPQKFLSQKYDDGTHETMRLRGARFAVCHEPDQRMILDESKVKYLTGRDQITARMLYHNSVTFNPTHKLFLVTNHKPAVRSQTRAIWRRIALWPFEYTVPPEAKDRDLPAKLQTEAPGILNWLLIGCSEWVTAGHTCDPPSCVIEATQTYKRDEDFLAEWLERCTYELPDAETSFGDLYESYQAWAKGCGIEKPLSRRKLSGALEERGYRRRTLHGQRIILGIQRRQ